MTKDIITTLESYDIHIKMLTRKIKELSKIKS